MKHIELWRPTKFVHVDGELRCGDVSPGSRFISDVLARTYRTAIERHARGRLLDVGCGRVPLFGVYRERVTEIVCVDWATADASPHLDVVCDLNEPLPFPPSRFDTILATDVLEHLRRPDTFWSETTRVLQPDGKLILGVPFLYWLHEEPHDYARYTEHKLRAWCDEHGLRVLELEPYGGAPDVLADLTGKAVMRSRLLSAAHLALSRFASRRRPWTALSQASSRRFPLGYCLVAQKPALTSGSPPPPP